MSVVRPHITLAVLTSIGLACALLMFVFPAEGIQLGLFRLKFKTWNNSADSLGERKIDDVEKYLAQFDSLAMVADSLRNDSLKSSLQRPVSIAALQFKDGDSSPFFTFFHALDSASGSQKIHVYHFGDSQIETDRMTGMIREKLQQQFGGHGPGLTSPLPVTASSNIVQSQSSNWKRYTSYGFDDGNVNHNRFGVMCSFARFTPSRKKTDIDSTMDVEAWLEFRPSGMSQPHCKTYNQAIMYFGNHQFPFTLSVYHEKNLLWQKRIETSPQMQILSWPVTASQEKLKFQFVGSDSPDVYALSFQDSTGVAVSNIALRGNDGSAMSKTNGTEIHTTFQHLGSDLIILQFGGNAIPYLKGEQSAANYGKSFQSWIRNIKSYAPHAAILVVGPSDMSTSIDGVYQTWPYLEKVRDGMKEAAFNEHCAFWDMYEVMGGRNSMISWVTNNPPYAGPDYTHFTPAGAKKMAELLYKAINDEYEAWRTAQKPY